MKRSRNQKLCLLFEWRKTKRKWVGKWSQPRGLLGQLIGIVDTNYQKIMQLNINRLSLLITELCAGNFYCTQILYQWNLSQSSLNLVLVVLAQVSIFLHLPIWNFLFNCILQSICTKTTLGLSGIGLTRAYYKGLTNIRAPAALLFGGVHRRNRWAGDPHWCRHRAGLALV